MNMEFDNQLLEMPNLAKLTDLNAFEYIQRKVFKLKNCKTFFKVVLSIRASSMQFTDIDAF